jgi:protoporphyrin/coproporphyrin ferrochelatase
VAARESDHCPFPCPEISQDIQETLDGKWFSPVVFRKLNEKKLQELLGDEYVVKLGMRYQSPGIAHALNELSRHPLRSLIILPLFPQYASATTGSVHQKVMEIILQWTNIPEIKFINTYFDHPLFIKAFVERAKKRLHPRSFDFMLFSYHGLPERQIYKSSTGNYCQLNDCCRTYHEKNMNCYRAQCFETSRILAKALNIPVDKYKVVFQSRLGKDPWIQPYAEEVIRSLPASGYKKLPLWFLHSLPIAWKRILRSERNSKKFFFMKAGKNGYLSIA